MKTKQLAGIIVTGVVIIAVGVVGTFSNIAVNKTKKASDSFMESFMSLEMDEGVSLPEKDFVGVINIVGTIQANTGRSWASTDEYNHNLYMKYIDQMKNSRRNKGIMLYVDSPGGSVYESDELYLKLMEYKEETNRPVYAYFATQACSGGYYIAMAADKIYANRNCWTGSIGVIISLLNYKNLYDKLGIKEIDITSGENKAMGSGGLNLTDEQKKILQSLVDEAYDQFVGIVSDGRGMDVETVRSLADGRLYSAQQAFENGLIDAVATEDELKQDFVSDMGVSQDILFFEPQDSTSLFMGSLFGAAQDLVPKSDNELAVDILENNGNGVLMYYAK